MEFFTVAQIQEAKTAELVAFYNENNKDKPIKKFADRATAEKRCIDLMNVLNSPEFDETTGTISDDAKEKLESGEEIKEVEFKAAPILPAKNAPSAGVKNAFELAGEIGEKFVSNLDINPAAKTNGANAAPRIPRVRTSNSAGVAASWADPAVATARLTRNGVSVEVDGVVSEFKSVRDAFREHRLPDSKHIRFRGQLKAAKTATFEQGGKKYNFTITG